MSSNSFHLYDVRKIIKQQSTSIDSFTKHFLSHFTNLEQASMANLRSSVDLGLIYNVKRLSRAGTDSCELCSAERFYLLKYQFLQRPLVNFKDEIYFSCRHRREFPRWKLDADFTDDPGGENT